MRRRIAIICGGTSSEYAVSLRSAEGLCSFFDKERYALRVVEMSGDGWQVHTSAGRVPLDLNTFTYIDGGVRCGFDYAYITIHGTPGETGELQGYLDLIGMPYSTGGVLVEALTADKYVASRYLHSFGIPTATSLLLRQGETLPDSDALLAAVGLPCFVKPVSDGSSYGVSKVLTREALQPAIQEAFSRNDTIMVEEYLAGMEVSQGVYHRRGDIIVLPATEVVTANAFFDYDAKYNGQVEEITPARISTALMAQLSAMTRRIYALLHCNGIVRIDYILTPCGDGTTRINMLEVNTTPGMTLTSFIPQQVRAAGMDIKEVLRDVVENAF